MQAQSPVSTAGRGRFLTSLALALAFVALTALAPQPAAAQIPYPSPPDSAAGGNGGAADGADGLDLTYTTGSEPNGIFIFEAAGGGAGAVGGPGNGGAGGDITVILENGATIGNLNEAGAPPYMTNASVTGANGGAANDAAGGAAGTFTLRAGGTATITNLNLTGGDGGAGGALAANVGGAGGNAVFTDNGNANSVTTIFGNLNIISGDGGADGAGGAGGAGGNAAVNSTGMVRFVNNTLAPAPQHIFVINRGLAGATAAAGEVRVNIGTLEAAATSVQMNIGSATPLIYDYDGDGGAVTTADHDTVTFNTLKLTNGGVFNTATGTLIPAYDQALAPAAQQYVVTNTYVTGLDNRWATLGDYAPAATRGTMTFDVTGVPANPAVPMLTMTGAGLVDFGGFGPVNGQGNPNLVITGAKAVQRALVGRTITMVDGATNWGASQWGNMGAATTANTVAYYSQVGTSRFYYNTFGQDNGVSPDQLRAAALYELSPGKVYSQYQAATAETAADIFLNNTWAANRDVVDIAQPDTFALTGRLSYFSINQDQDHSSEADKDQLGVAISGGYKFENNAGQTTVGAFIEYGHGDYDTDTRLRGWGGAQGALGVTSDTFQGNGDADLFGGGLFVYHDFLEGTYLDGGFRFGNIDQKFNFTSHGMNHGSRIDTSTDYWGLDFGVGHKFAVWDNALLDLYGKFLWTRLGDNTFRNGFGEQVHMNSIDSIRTRIGARVEQNMGGNGDVTLYYGAAWEQEWDGESTGSLDHVRFREAADNSGASAFGEVGLKYKPQDQPFAVEVGAFGLAGAQQGGGGTISLKFDF